MLELTESIGKIFTCEQLWRYSHVSSYLVHSLLEPVTIGLICTFCALASAKYHVFLYIRCVRRFCMVLREETKTHVTIAMC